MVKMGLLARPYCSETVVVQSSPTVQQSVVQRQSMWFEVRYVDGLSHTLDLNKTGLRWVVSLVTLFLSGIPAIVYIVPWAILKPRPTADVVDV